MLLPPADPSGDLIKNDFKNFLSTFHLSASNSETLTPTQRFLSNYVAQLSMLCKSSKTTLFVDFQHIVEYDHELAEALELYYYRFEPHLRVAVHEIVAQRFSGFVAEFENNREYFVAIYNQPRVEKIRSMKSDKVGKLISVGGTVTRTSEVKPEMLYGCFICKKCNTVEATVEQQYQFTEPRVCKNPTCSSSSFQLEQDQSMYVDWQRLRVQENADEIPAGSMPRCIDVICRNEIVESAKAGDKIVFTGSVAVIADTSGLARVGDTTTTGKTVGRGDNNGDGVTGLQSLGVKEMTYRILFVANNIVHVDEPIHEQIHHLMGYNDNEQYGGAAGAASDSEQQDHLQTQIPTEMSEADTLELMTMLQTPQLYSKMVESMCPGVFGHNEVKRGILLMLFGGVHKSTKEGISLRGDINVCIVGDPSCAKSQFLKYVHGFLPHTVYTSGKSSSAAGLTASVVRDPDTGEHCIEAGALMLADNGICCIDEFDKMDPADQVAIHEAMEQQTISITKAGIQATLNARTSILAAANPVFGRYDRSKPLKSNVTISAPIMSRFDLFFVILDECNPVVDDLIARHIINSHRNISKDVSAQSKAPFSMEQLQKYIKFARSINPVITKESRKVLVDCYRLLRQNDLVGKNKTAYRITVRQLESLVRLSEALARLHLSDKVLPPYVREAYRLLQKSIIFVETEDIDLDENEEDMNNILQEKLLTDNASNEGKGVEALWNSSIIDSDNVPVTQSNNSNEHEGDGIDTNQGSAKRSRPSEDAYQAMGESNNMDQEVAKESREVVHATKKKKSQISAKEYEQMTQLIVHFMLQQADDAHDVEQRGVKWIDVVQWYIQQVQEELVGIEAFEAKRKVVNQVIKRMVKHDNILIVIGDTLEGDQSLNEQKYLQLHPSHEG